MFLNKKEHSEIAKSALDPKEGEVLGDICEFLAMPHAAQELLSGEYTPTLCQVIPVYEELLESLRELRLEKIEQDKPQIGRAIAACIKKIEDYVSKARKNRIYAIAMSRFFYFSCSDIRVIKFSSCSYQSSLQTFVDGETLVSAGSEECEGMDYTNGKFIFK